jgi:outer membrane protein assembly factor BamB
MRYSKKQIIIVSLALSYVILGLVPCRIQAEDWSTFRHDNRRSGITSEQPSLPLEPYWEVISETPKTAWSGPAKWDSYADIVNLKSMRNFDPVYYTTSANGYVFYGSSVDDAVHCLDLGTGQEVWVFHTDGPVRLPPTYVNGTLLFGSDDGYVYCLDAISAEVLWKLQAAESPRNIPNNGKLISMWPCRTGVLVQDDIAYFAASLLPWKETYLCGVDVETGDIQGTGCFKKVYSTMTAQGPLLASQDNLYVSQGRQAPLVFRRHDGQRLKTLGKSGFGGVFGLLTEDSVFVHGHGQKRDSGGELRFFSGSSQDLLVTFPRATTIVIHEEMIYLHHDTQLQAFPKDVYLQQKRVSDVKWKVNCACSLSLILAGDTLFAGGKDEVIGYDRRTGQQVWKASVSGRAYGLTLSQGCLLVSTDLGRIVCFGPGSK